MEKWNLQQVEAMMKEAAAQQARPDETTASRIPEVHLQLEHLAKALAFQIDAIDRLAKRLEIVSSPRPQTVKESRPPGNITVPLALALAEQVARALATGERLMALCDALEI